MEDYERWWRSLDPGIRLVYVQAVWEGEGEPRPMPRKACDYRRRECTNEGRTVYGQWVCSNHDPEPKF